MFVVGEGELSRRDKSCWINVFLSSHCLATQRISLSSVHVRRTRTEVGLVSPVISVFAADEESWKSVCAAVGGGGGMRQQQGEL